MEPQALHQSAHQPRGSVEGEQHNSLLLLRFKLEVINHRVLHIINMYELTCTLDRLPEAAAEVVDPCEDCWTCPSSCTLQ
eukprot:8386670-Alexandrium_andersonii.AAC.1